MEVYRIVQERYSDDLSGYGSYYFGGRWNSERVFALYTSSTRALALLELLVHVPINIITSQTYIMLTLEIKSEPLKFDIDISRINDYHYTRGGGDQMLKNPEILSFFVPSILLPEEQNVIINPRCKYASDVKITNKKIFKLDQRFAIE
jgi:RES domain-containing protein